MCLCLLSSTGTGEAIVVMLYRTSAANIRQPCLSQPKHGTVFQLWGRLRNRSRRRLISGSSCSVYLGVLCERVSTIETARGPPSAKLVFLNQSFPPRFDSVLLRPLISLVFGVNAAEI
jgi:hypothetical protein